MSSFITRKGFVIGTASVTLLLLLIQVLYTKYYSEQPSQKGHLSPRGGYFNYQPTAKLPTNEVEKKADNWIVVTTINQPTDAIRTLAQLPNWKVVVVADKYVIISDIIDTYTYFHSFPIRILIVEFIFIVRIFLMVLYLHRKTPSDWALLNCEFLSKERQQELGYKGSYSDIE